MCVRRQYFFVIEFVHGNISRTYDSKDDVFFKYIVFEVLPLKFHSMCYING